MGTLTKEQILETIHDTVGLLQILRANGVKAVTSDNGISFIVPNDGEE